MDYISGRSPIYFQGEDLWAIRTAPALPMIALSRGGLICLHDSNPRQRIPCPTVTTSGTAAFSHAIFHHKSNLKSGFIIGGQAISYWHSLPDKKKTHFTNFRASVIDIPYNIERQFI
jgi:hypothetical protein